MSHRRANGFGAVRSYGWVGARHGIPTHAVGSVSIHVVEPTEGGNLSVVRAIPATLWAPDFATGGSTPLSGVVLSAALPTRPKALRYEKIVNEIDTKVVFALSVGRLVWGGSRGAGRNPVDARCLRHGQQCRPVAGHSECDQTMPRLSQQVRLVGLFLGGCRGLCLEPGTVAVYISVRSCPRRRLGPTRRSGPEAMYA